MLKIPLTLSLSHKGRGDSVALPYVDTDSCTWARASDVDTA